MVENEKGEKKRTATEGLMWLLRGLSFTCKALEGAQADKKQELSAAFLTSYEDTLKKFHNFVVKGIFAVYPYLPPCVMLHSQNTPESQVAMKACPYRAVFYAKLAADPSGGPAASEEKLDEELNKWLVALAKIVAHMEAFYEKGGYGKGL